MFVAKASPNAAGAELIQINAGGQPPRGAAAPAEAPAAREIMI
jgi:hypothetical protein